MEIKTITQTVIEASDGFILTNGIAYGKTVSLGVSDSVENWHEITQEEYDALMAQIEQESETDVANSL